MAWVRIDDGFAEHPKVLRVGSDAAWLHIAALCHCNRVQTDGVIHAEMLPRLSDKRSPLRLVEKLVAVGMWDVHPDGWAIHDYLDYQPSKEELAARRQVRAEAGRLGGIRSGEVRRSKAEATDEANGKQTGSKLLGLGLKQTRTPSRPVPTPPVTSFPQSSSLYADGPFDGREDLIIGEFARLKTASARNVRNPKTYAAKCAKEARNDPAAMAELQRLSSLFPTAPPAVIAAAALGEKHSLTHYPRADEIDTKETA